MLAGSEDLKLGHRFFVHLGLAVFGIERRTAGAVHVSRVGYRHRGRHHLAPLRVIRPPALSRAPGRSRLIRTAVQHLSALRLSIARSSPSGPGHHPTAGLTPSRVLLQCGLRFQFWCRVDDAVPTPIEARASPGRSARADGDSRGLETHSGPHTGLLMTSDVAHARPLSPDSGEGPRLE